MTEPTPGRPTMDDDLDQAYARAHALADGGRGPSGAVRANVLAAACEVAALAATPAGTASGDATPPLTPVAPQVAAVGRGRAGAINLSSWRVRSGAALCAVLLVGLGAWRLDASRRFSGDTQLAAADASIGINVVESKAPPPPKDLPPPASLSEAPAASPPPVDAPSPAPQLARSKAAVRDRDLVVAQADQPYRQQANAPLERKAQAAEPSPPAVAQQAASPEAAKTSGASVPALAPLPPPVLVATAPPPVAAQIAATNAAAAPAAPRAAMAAAPLPATVAAARPAAPESTTTIAAAPQAAHDETAGGQARAATGFVEAARKARPAADARLASRIRPTPLHLAANDDDVEALKRLLADPATQVDATDAQGRTALMYAVMAARVPAVRLLLSAGADPGHADQSGQTPRDVARTGPSAEIAALLGVPR